jgi:hypothetical protein
LDPSKVPSVTVPDSSKKSEPMLIISAQDARPLFGFPAKKGNFRSLVLNVATSSIFEIGSRMIK